MDTSALIVERSEEEFAQAIRQLLPKGQYWQESDNAELTALIEGMGAEFKITHAEVQLALLTGFEGDLFGWRLSDYQALLIDCDIKGRVHDTQASPNLIFVSLLPGERSEKAWREFERVRLPHTAIQWIYNASTTLQVQLGNARYIRNTHTHKATL
ncbi:hypothetical protein [Aliivibrio finisterrensis]|uniref:Uncharacterized protein n=1 Tax=Aliivibrio finisterrensis TaxID=511998 RepID=A0ABY0I3X3_9GAMM|nr:hypothetical protein [Aliivibrio finisterrensis]RYU50028.1 hypothetical protein ERW56_15760 [Aliivibrio finisterrensis]RYU55729.1 hypothetical protein ERW50_15815 [Aliivibrio finisterrensis]RYU62183.1 hypothetical protein ERW53_16870 [Aliivibrio finisterrensis]RYU80920.1 hypothetical protein ERW55_15630 [Aliivibrio finisterrensis]RYU84467.1 hypothetical protein ERW52_10875 [Aliivibrio finisterrensis]